MRVKLFVVARLLFAPLPFLPGPAIAWSGTDSNGNTIEIEQGQIVRPGRDIDAFSSGSGYGQYSVESVTRSGRTVEIEVYDYSKGEPNTFEMDDLPTR